MKKIVAGTSALTLMVVALLSFALPNKNNEQPAAKNERPVVDYYFEFNGTPNLQEGDISKWSQISALQYLSGCTGSKLGCKIRTSDTTMQGTTVRPKEVRLESGTNNPEATGTVTGVRNLQP